MLIPHVKWSLRFKEIIFFSAGAKQYFKNKFPMVHLIHREEDFNIKADWSFNATVHSKSASDGIGALCKREAARNSLLCKLTDANLIREKLTEWGQRHFQNITTLFYSKKRMTKLVGLWGGLTML